MEEIWKDIKGYEGYFKISNFGRVISVERWVKQGNSTRHVKGSFKKLHMGACGYPSITLCKEGKSREFPIHRLLATAFIPNPDGKEAVDHINTDRTDYRIENLRWVTNRENSNNELTLQHCKENTYTQDVVQKRMSTMKERKTINAPKTVYQYTKTGEFIREFYSMQEAENITGINHNSIHRALNDCTQSAGNFLWTDFKTSNICYRRRMPSSSKPVVQYDKNGNILGEWQSINEASRLLGIPTANITRSIKSSSVPRKYKFKYKEDE